MSTAEPQNKFAKYWWLALLGVCIILCATRCASGHDPKDVVARIPIGSKLSELDKHLGKFYGSSSVEEWGNAPTATRASKQMKSEYGFSYVRELCTYEAWTASNEERDTFTGKVEFTHYSSMIPDDIAPSYVVWLVYVDGVLKEKDYGHLPG